MKLLSIAVPCYNSQDYMKKCLDSLLHGGDEVEILIVDDGSSDATADIADEYAEKYPNIIKAIHQENAGHGGAVNTGLQNATAEYFKVVDSDDWVDAAAYKRILETLRNFSAEANQPDLLISNYIYDKVGKKHKAVIRYNNILPENRILEWNDVKSFRVGQYFLMHSIIYKRQLLIDCGLELPKHTFYVDNLYACLPMPRVRTLYYLNVDFYHYFIGREGQSVQEKIMLKRIDQQLLVNRLMADSLRLDEIEIPRLRQCVFGYLEIITAVSTTLLMRSGTPEHLKKKDDLWLYIKENNQPLYKMLRRGLFGKCLHLPGSVGRKFSLTVYSLAQKLVGFN